MSKCYITGKTTLFGNKRSHAMNATKKIWKANLQKIRILNKKGKKQKIYISARALKKLELKRV
ncbi:MAG: 50S ribosomal protein L28 [Candidatus Phytoplasma stylosanthis]|uniref:50S ribosomal protein L28 n=1 Tax=Candidatus Phytoplasma stylosanthis TaxID=2798314 RepID=UPI00293AE14B|nr:50S ribosomal protein L28 [Candidatus Phytoplasma stylosanthis]MDV3168133.1 50S ribosomal protein L28 [Candidatus Phytoplasma stylosanthis]MDV3171102.1 50S ribosomal protein L28 [Candidatus Phytoplasma stylosanthis]MDV3174322.1 50S ribosomal protein L28 [Candidatus Phytoplasma stylosanthis]MDV3195997.1 50S ribosomal protein L28 [Candidatus Phytoplasma stylosanthis]MDV3202641.1 50S ribosomal protein L28 [Candidatus Phytoplasma stylosanthis]